jgi:hypothetical protein
MAAASSRLLYKVRNVHGSQIQHLLGRYGKPIHLLKSPMRVRKLAKRATHPSLAGPGYRSGAYATPSLPEPYFMVVGASDENDRHVMSRSWVTLRHQGLGGHGLIAKAWSKL